jgi:hypothetical protein
MDRGVQLVTGYALFLTHTLIGVMSLWIDGYEVNEHIIECSRVAYGSVIEFEM